MSKKMDEAVLMILEAYREAYRHASDMLPSGVYGVVNLVDLRLIEKTIDRDTVKAITKLLTAADKVNQRQEANKRKKSLTQASSKKERTK